MKGLTSAALSLALALGVTTAEAIPLVGTILNDTNFSLIRDGSMPSGTGDRALWRYFESEQQLNLDSSDRMLTLADPQELML